MDLEYYKQVKVMWICGFVDLEYYKKVKVMPFPPTPPSPPSPPSQFALVYVSP